MSTLVGYNGLQIVSPDPTGNGGLAINNNFKALSTKVSAGDPAAGNDGTQGFVAGSRWYNSTSTVEWICLSNATGAAVWTAVTSGGRERGSEAVLTGVLNVEDPAVRIHAKKPETRRLSLVPPPFGAGLSVR